ncbi:uracil-DNA glycosylase [Phototrophicus methaneseepsis]|uniref:Type-4 uracil-DNA glycosylase n=1 Tax=Phototrophicus methaneseepsis TaxID=2710758 RepID=A0A7S8EDB0_9CHLR|nr:uracil-DNA glycosylase [Phototrophicus methaneseepsis]QPC84638.1 uracil-DNA glycosylase [Phototrophicus methaneseepsis]
MSDVVPGKTEQMRAIKDAIVNLKESPLYEYRTSHNYYPVIGQGSHDASIMFIGEAPGKNEAEQGRPFCGASGRLLDEMLDSINLKREDVYVTNIVKDRPPDNRDPRSEEIELYAPFLDQQIEIIQPEVIATLGRFSMVWILERFGSPKASQKISQLHGQLIPVKAGYGDVMVIPLFHPAAALYRQDQKETLMKDFQVLKEFI